MRVCYILVLVFILSFSSVYAVNGTLTVFTFRDITNNELIDNVAVYITAEGETSSYFIPSEGVLRVSDLNQNVDLVVKADDYSTAGNDYYQVFKAGSFESGVANVYLVPVGSVRGIVKDSLDNVVPYAKLKIDCGNFDYPAQTDEFGSFFVDYIPVGSCMAYASYGDATGTVNIDMDKGNLTDVEILLDKSLIVPRKPLDYSLIGILFFVVVIILFFIRRKFKTQKQVMPEANNLDKTSTKIMETLNEKEKKVVDYLLTNNNTAMQSSIRHATHIPRTSLSRVVDSLQNKKIITVEKIGKTVKLTLTEFFLDKD